MKRFPFVTAILMAAFVFICTLGVNAAKKAPTANANADSADGFVSIFLDCFDSLIVFYCSATGITYITFTS